MRAMHLLSLKQQVGEGLAIKGLHFGKRPIVTNRVRSHNDLLNTLMADNEQKDGDI
jgi:hypothetical protein